MTNTKLQIPFSPKETAHCYERLPKMRNVFRDGVDKIRKILEGSESLGKRFQQAMTMHQQVLDQSQQEPPNTAFVEEDFYLCCIYDMLESAVAAECEAAVKENDGNRLEAVNKAIAALPFGSPQYRTGVRPRLEKHVTEALKQLSESKKERRK